MIQTKLNDKNQILVTLDQLKPWDKNPRDINPADMERLKTQIKRLGQYKPLLVTEEGVVIGGNMRLRAYREMGMTDAWVSIVSPKNDSELLEYALSDNDRAGFYKELELMELVKLNPIDQQLYAIDLGKPLVLADFMENQRQKNPLVEDEPPEVSNDPSESKTGEVYQLGKHRLMCGDSTLLANVKVLMGELKADMVFTDPPYNVDYTGKTKDALKIGNDSMEDSKFYEFLYMAFANMADVSKSGAGIYVCHADSEGLNFRKAFINAGFLLKQCIIWNKNTMVMGRQDYQWKHEPILYGWKDGGSHQFYGDRSQTTVWDIPKPSKSEEHPTMKPIALVAEALNNSSKSEDIILDLFGGSGTTLMTCEQTGRVCRTMELDPRYCDVIRKRYARFIGKEDQWKELTPPVQS